MKNLILPCLLILSIALQGQDKTFMQRHLSHKDGKVYYQKVVEVDGAVAEDMFTSAKIWANDAFGVGKNDIQVEELERGVLVFFGSVNEGHLRGISNPSQSFKLKLEFKDGKYRYTMYDFVYSFESGEYLSSKELEVFINEFIANLAPTSKRLKAFSNYLVKINKEFLLLMDKLEQELKSMGEEEDW